MLRRFAFGALVLSAVALTLSACEEPPSSAMDGKPAPEFAVMPLHPGGDLKLSDYKGKVVLLDFWATWCGPCRSIMPQLGAFQKQYGDQGLQIIGISSENQTTVQKFFEAMGEPGYTIGVDRKASASDKYMVGSLPTTVLIGRDGKVKHVEVGVNEQVGLAPLEERIKQALAEKS